jgi:hypothetical protein
MNCKLTFTEKPSYLHIVVTGQNSIENVVQYFDEIYRECKDRDALRILIEERLEGPRLGITEVFQIVEDLSKRVKGMFKNVAYVDVNARTDSMKFAEDVAVNRSIPLAVFSTVVQAKKWLTSEDNGST